MTDFASCSIGATTARDGVAKEKGQSQTEKAERESRSFAFRTCGLVTENLFSQ